MEVAEVVQRKAGMRLRVGFGTDGALLEPIEPDPVLPLGAFVAIDRVGEHHARVRFGADGQPLVIAAADTALAEVHRIAARCGLRPGYAPEVQAETDALLAAPGIDDPALVDLTALPFVTIDYETSRDLDQALHVTRDGDGFGVWYALADAAYYVRPGSALFADALVRGTSYYLPGLTVPMLPPELSEGIVSLNPGVDRRALVFRMLLDATGQVRSTELVRARIHSRAKLTYDGVQAHFDAPARSPLRDREFTASLELLAEVGRLRIAHAEARDVVKYDRIAVRLSLRDAGAERVRIDGEPRNDVQAWNEQISLLTNIEGARFLAARVDPSTGLAGVFRVHEPPTELELGELRGSIDELVKALELEPTWRWDRARESLGDYIGRLPDEGPRARLSRALQRQAMILGRASYFAITPGPHYGIGAAAYSRFSSPMREIVGVVTKHLALHQLAGTSVAQSGLTRALIEAACESGNRSKALQKRATRDANKLAIDQLFTSELERAPEARTVYDATVMGLSAAKIYLQLDAPPIEIKLYTVDQAQLLGSTPIATSRFELRVGKRIIRVGDAVRARVHGYDRARDRWVMRLL
ncbi:MAG TPA: RNB domain-containing ribonuclease [Kofleriaceae bacterium]|nr:RNB domain-containing ribonuclease [Kofleriaceae bacterium]